MCGIIGYISDKPSEQNYSLLKDLLYLAASRGTDATGIAVVGSEKTKIVKEDLPSDKFIEKHYVGLKKEIVKSKIVLGHTRLATQGHQRDNNNNHPIIGEKYVMVHNGTCSTMSRLTDYTYKGTVDSEILLSHIERKGLRAGLKALKGSAAIAIVSADEPNIVYVWRHHNPLWLAYNEEKKTLFFASTEPILREGLSDILDFFSSFHMREIAEDVLYRITCNPLKVEALEEIEPVGWNSGQALSGIRGGYDYDYTNFGCGMEGDEERGTKTNNKKTTPLNSDTPPDKTLTNLYKEVLACTWDAKRKVYATGERDNLSTATRFYFDGPSYDFVHWRHLEGGGYVSIDKKLFKLFDHSRKAHFIMTVIDAIKENLIDLSK